MARILGRSGLNFPNSDALEIHGWRSEGADEAVAAAVEAARRKTSTQYSQYRGVTWHKQNAKWLAKISITGTGTKHLGYFDKEREAALAFDVEARKLGKETHFPEAHEVTVGATNRPRV